MNGIQFTLGFVLVFNSSLCGAAVLPVRSSHDQVLFSYGTFKNVSIHNDTIRGKAMCIVAVVICARNAPVKEAHNIVSNMITYKM